MKRGNPISSRIPSLDGLRACSIMLVLLGHLNGTLRYPFAELVRHFGDVANLGVRVFFVISGFLITHLLLEEWDKTNSISLRGFYIRRVFRIFPAFYTFVAAVALLTLAGIIVVPWVDLGFAATYTINFVERKPWHVGHLWSLAVEEQFYLLWPLCLAALTIGRARRIAVGAIALAPLLRIGVWYLLPEYRPLISKAFPTICDTIATGCMLACYRQWLWDQSWYRGLLSSKAFAVVPLIVLVSNIFASHTRQICLLVKRFETSESRSALIGPCGMPNRSSAVFSIGRRWFGSAHSAIRCTSGSKFFLTATPLPSSAPFRSTSCSRSPLPSSHIM
jgi:peptidoglycan/LPS O-acetylase OafA/YrhL